MRKLWRLWPLVACLWLVRPVAAQPYVVSGFNSSRTESGASFIDGFAFSRARERPARVRDDEGHREAGAGVA